MDDVWKGFRFDKNEENDNEPETLDVQLQFEYADRETVLEQYMQLAKTLGSEEQLEQFLKDIYDQVYAIGYAESLADSINDAIGQLDLVVNGN